MKNILKNWKTTSLGIVAIVLLVLVNSGSLSVAEGEDLNKALKSLIEHVDAIVATILSIAFLLSKDADVK